MFHTVTGVLVPSDTSTPPSLMRLGPEKIALMRSEGGLLRVVDLPQPAATLWVFRDDDRLPRNPRASLIMRAANPEKRQETVCGDAVLLGVADVDGGYRSAPPDYTDVLLLSAGRFRVEFQPPQGGRRLALSSPEWTEVFTAYRQGLSVGRALPRMAVRVVCAP
ncbi:hypothetical protein [Frankia sp. AgKG'84/4]|uniref:hypothetical protein n=1 Tax=Frankia sp. AgKG'84/4 TaxID=573490 RepID=UPI0020103B7A|nr:hypothetical protein [Frankia sp. AgKG'84/4]MCL9793282.1 hypothetical protein [Frankia sp. AgKG'84/4]